MCGDRHRTGGSVGAGRYRQRHATTAEDTPVSIHVLERLVSEARPHPRNRPRFARRGEHQQCRNAGDTTDDYIVYTPNADSMAATVHLYGNAAADPDGVRLCHRHRSEMTSACKQTTHCRGVAEDSGTRVIILRPDGKRLLPARRNERPQTLTHTM